MPGKNALFFFFSLIRTKVCNQASITHTLTYCTHKHGGGVFIRVKIQIMFVKIQISVETNVNNSSFHFVECTLKSKLWSLRLQGAFTYVACSLCSDSGAKMMQSLHLSIKCNTLQSSWGHKCTITLFATACHYTWRQKKKELSWACCNMCNCKDYIYKDMSSSCCMKKTQQMGTIKLPNRSLELLTSGLRPPLLAEVVLAHIWVQLFCSHLPKWASVLG